MITHNITDLGNCDSCGELVLTKHLKTLMVCGAEGGFCEICRNHLEHLISRVEEALLQETCDQYERTRSEIIENYDHDIFRDIQNRAFKKIFRR